MNDLLERNTPAGDGTLSTRYLILAFGFAFFLPLAGFVFGLYTFCKGSRYVWSAIAIMAVTLFSFISGIGPGLLFLAIVYVVILVHNM